MCIKLLESEWKMCTGKDTLHRKRHHKQIFSYYVLQRNIVFDYHLYVVSAKNGKIEVANKLINLGASKVELADHQRYGRSVTPLDVAITKDMKEILQLSAEEVESLKEKVEMTKLEQHKKHGFRSKEVRNSLKLNTVELSYLFHGYIKLFKYSILKTAFGS